MVAFLTRNLAQFVGNLSVTLLCAYQSAVGNFDVVAFTVGPLILHRLILESLRTAESGSCPGC